VRCRQFWQTMGAFADGFVTEALRRRQSSSSLMGDVDQPGTGQVPRPRLVSEAGLHVD
jgi:hypothetical protein